MLGLNITNSTLIIIIFYYERYLLKISRSRHYNHKLTILVTTRTESLNISVNTAVFFHYSL